MKIGVSAYSFTQYMKKTGANYFDVCNKAKELGFSGIEFVELNSDNQIALADEIAAHCRKIGLDIIAYSVGANFNTLFKTRVVGKLKKQVDVAAALGSPLMRHDVCYKLLPWQTWQGVVKKIAPYVREVSEYARSKHVKTCTENHGFIIQNSERVKMLHDEVNSDNYGLLCDIGNFLCADEEPKHAVPVVAPYAIHVHTKDFLRRTKEEGMEDGYFRTASGNYLCGTVLGEGVVPVEFCLNTLEKAGYDGYISFEYEGKEDCVHALKEGLDFVKALPIFNK